MSEPVVTSIPVATTETPATDASAAPKVAPSLADIKAKRAATPVVAATTTNTPKPNEAPKTETPKTETAQVDYSAKAMEEIAKLNAAKRDLETKLKDYEPAKTQAQKFSEAMALAKDGKHLAAIEALGLDITAANLELLGQSPTHEQETATAKEIAALKTKLEEVEGSVTQRAVVEAEIAIAEGKKAVIEHVKTNATKYPYLSKKDSWVMVALAQAKTDYDNAVASGKEFTDEERDTFVAKALDNAEKERAEDAKIYGAPQVSGDLRNGNVADSSSTNANGSTATPDITRGQITQPATKTATKLTWEQLKARRRQLQQ